VTLRLEGSCGVARSSLVAALLPLVLRRTPPVLVSLFLHGAVVIFVAAIAQLPRMEAVESGMGQASADWGGSSEGVAMAVEEPDFGPALVDIARIGIVVDAPVAPPAAEAAPASVEPAPAPAPKKPAAKPTAKVAAPPSEPTVAGADAAPTDAEVEAAPDQTAEALAQAFDSDLARRHAGKKIARGSGKPMGKGKQPTCPVNDDDGIERVDTHTYTVEREVVDYYAKHLKELNKLGSVRAHEDADGRAAGFRLGMGRCSLLRKGGLRSGDVVADVDGIRVNDLFGAVAAYFKLRHRDRIEVHVIRKGQPITLRYTLV
jgi:hypothetical protein